VWNQEKVPPNKVGGPAQQKNELEKEAHLKRWGSRLLDFTTYANELILIEKV